tara:strand:+ start:1312 stop:1962 length:651 start_codon:yes stop_codon:yes gene_type:complete
MPPQKTNKACGCKTTGALRAARTQKAAAEKRYGSSATSALKGLWANAPSKDQMLSAMGTANSFVGDMIEASKQYDFSTMKLKETPLLKKLTAYATPKFGAAVASIAALFMVVFWTLSKPKIMTAYLEEFGISDVWQKRILSIAERVTERRRALGLSRDGAVQAGRATGRAAVQAGRATGRAAVQAGKATGRAAVQAGKAGVQAGKAGVQAGRSYFT